MAKAKYTVICKVCGGEIELPDDVMDGEITSCPTCGTRYIVRLKDGKVELEEFKGDVEDYGE
ncbi:MAG: lysine biosynthesis protein [Thermoproteus sp.]